MNGAPPLTDTLTYYFAPTRKRPQERQENAEQTFEKSPDSFREAFTQAHDRTGGEKDWRSLREERQQGNLFDRKR